MESERAPAPRSAAHAEAQRARILEAAQRRFVESGFHAATMAQIAETAGVSAGLIYRYFESKNAIVLAIVERQLEERRARIARLRGAEDLVARLVKAFDELRRNDPGLMNGALFLEMSAEATRHPELADAIRASDLATRDNLQAWLAGDGADGGAGLAPGDAQAHAVLLQIIIEGIVVRAAREPGLDPTRLRRALERALP